MKNIKEEDEDLLCRTFTWRITNFSELKNDKHSSDVFIVGGFKWKVLIYTNGKDVKEEKQLAMYLVVADSNSTLLCDWSGYSQLSLTLINQFDSNKSITKDSQVVFKENNNAWGFTSFMALSKFYDSNTGYLVNDTCIVEATVAVLKVEVKIEDQETDIPNTFQPSDKENKGQKKPANVGFADYSAAPMLPKGASSEPVCIESTNLYVVNEHVEDLTTPYGKLMDFRGLGRIDKAFVPLLDEVCSWHPSLIECQQKRSRMFTERAFTALGRFLHFLKITKVKNMNEDAHECLQLLWEEVEEFRFDLAWLEPHVQSVLGIKKRVGRMKRVREDVDVLENEIKRRKAMLAAAQVDLEIAKGDLKKVEEGFNEMDMDSELGYPLALL